MKRQSSTFCKSLVVTSETNQQSLGLIPGHTLGALEMKVLIEIFNFLIEVLFTKEKCLCALALSEMKHTGLCQ